MILMHLVLIISIDDIRASLAIVQLKKFKERYGKTKIIRDWYEKKLKEINDIATPLLDNKEIVSNYIFPVVLKDRIRR